ncbi:hypothetical protein DXG01_006482 [Tephrocybe rancida]|nr:hypothetical protein DXG01_006482 [Tephrocybe rancida]
MTPQRRHDQSYNFRQSRPSLIANIGNNVSKATSSEPKITGPTSTSQASRSEISSTKTQNSPLSPTSKGSGGLPAAFSESKASRSEMSISSSVKTQNSPSSPISSDSSPIPKGTEGRHTTISASKVVGAVLGGMTNHTQQIQGKGVRLDNDDLSPYADALPVVCAKAPIRQPTPPVTVARPTLDLLGTDIAPEDEVAFLKQRVLALELQTRTLERLALAPHVVNGPLTPSSQGPPEYSSESD